MKFKFENFKKNILQIIITFALLLGLNSCYEDESLNVPVKPPPSDILNTELDKYIQENFIDEYDMAIRYRYVDRYVQPGQRVTPPSLEAVRPMLDFIEKYWITPYLEVKNGEEFFRSHVPAEIIFLGGLIYNENGTVTLGTADAGARITFTNVNAVDPEDEDWRALQLQTVYHEFAHIVHQNYKLPPAFETISEGGYTSPGSWFNLSAEEALKRGFVSPYASSSPNEDFAETVAFYLFAPNFEEVIFIDEPNCATADCTERNQGRERIRQKLNAIMALYEKYTGIDLTELRENIQAKL